MLAFRGQLREDFRRENEERFRKLSKGREMSFAEFVEASIDFIFYCEKENRLRHIEPLANAVGKAVERGEAGTGGQDPALFAYLVSGAIEENIYSCLAFGHPSDVQSLREATKVFARKALAPEP